MFALRCCLAAALLAVGSCHATAAEPAKSVFLEELTWTEVRDALAVGKTTVIVPVGGTEQSGPQIVLGKHNARARALAGRIAASLGNAIVAPVIAYVPEGSITPPSGHMRFAGTISIPDAAFEATLEGAARSFRQHGFRDIVLIGDHGGYQKSLARVAARLDREWAATPVRVHAIEEYYLAADRGFAELLRKQGLSDAEIGKHAGAADTSLALAVDAQLVRSERLHDGSALGAAEGVSGDPRRASVAAGRAGLDLIVARTRDAIQREVARR
ncbi:MAG TPA: creatininase family protein [Caldimonas sp.]|jgi:creatinine amidohydrolase/Fe(II)-dependent formamide hydrolase-like protein|nr:creatininase family protein [Caldimonas sp.]HEX4233068.1 creatininase family protein [Caldimonas sp.]